MAYYYQTHQIEKLEVFKQRLKLDPNEWVQ